MRQCHSVDFPSSRRRLTSMGQCVHVPDARGTLICEMASIRLDLPALWLPTTAILGSERTCSVPRSRRRVIISLRPFAVRSWEEFSRGSDWCPTSAVAVSEGSSMSILAMMQVGFWKTELTVQGGGTTENAM